MAMISPETQTSRPVRKTVHLLNSVAEAAWPSLATWDLHRIGTEAHLAQRDILHALGQGAKQSETLTDIDIAAALEEAAHPLSATPQEFHNLDKERLEARVTSLARWAVALTPRPILTGRWSSLSGLERAHGVRCRGWHNLLRRSPTPPSTQPPASPVTLGSSPRSWCVKRSPHDPVG